MCACVYVCMYVCMCVCVCVCVCDCVYAGTDIIPFVASFLFNLFLGIEVSITYTLPFGLSKD